MPTAHETSACRTATAATHRGTDSAAHASQAALKALAGTATACSTASCSATRASGLCTGFFSSGHARASGLCSGLFSSGHTRRASTLSLGIFSSGSTSVKGLCPRIFSSGNTRANPDAYSTCQRAQVYLTHLSEVYFEIPGCVLIKIMDDFDDLVQHILRVEQSVGQAGKSGQKLVFHFSKEFISGLAAPILVQVTDPVAHGGV